MDANATPPPRGHGPSLPALAVTALVHVIVLALLMARPDPRPAAESRAAPAERTEVVFLPPRTLIGPPVPPPTLQAPPRAARPAQTQSPSAPIAPASEPSTTLRADPDRQRALDLRLPTQLRDPGPLPPRDLLRTPPVRLAGREEAYVEGIVMRRRLSPADIVAGIGALFFGGGRDPCDDIRTLLASATSDEERRDLIHRERRQRCR